MSPGALASGSKFRGGGGAAEYRAENWPVQVGGANGQGSVVNWTNDERTAVAPGATSTTLARDLLAIFTS